MGLMLDTLDRLDSPMVAYLHMGVATGRVRTTLERYRLNRQPCRRDNARHESTPERPAHGKFSLTCDHDTRVMPTGCMFPKGAIRAARIIAFEA